jgi:hypothetical protein
MDYVARILYEAAQRRSKLSAMNHVNKIMTCKVNECEPKNIPFVVNPVADAVIRKTIGFKYGGIHVVVAPKGSGKSMLLRRLVNDHIRAGGAAKYFGNESSLPSEFFTAFGAASRRMDLFDIMPTRSVIVIDQLEHMQQLSKDMESLLLHLAFESRRTAECNVIISLANIEMAKIILGLNGNDKIYQAGTAADFKWGEPEVTRFVELGCLTWSEDDKKALVKLGLVAKSPTFLHEVLSSSHSGLPSDISKLESTSLKYNKCFEDFSAAGL